MKKLLVVNYIVLVFLLLIAMAGVVTTVSTYEKYGISYVVTTITNGEMDTRTVTIYESVASVFVFVFLFCLLLYDVIQLGVNHKKI